MGSFFFVNDRYPSLRVAYVDELEERSEDGSKKTNKIYYSALAKAALASSTNSNEAGQNLDQVIFFYTPLYYVTGGICNLFHMQLFKDKN